MNKIIIDTAGWVRADAEAQTVEVRMTYDVNDPLAVQIRMTGRRDEETWVFARDLLADGLRSLVPVGEGDVHVQATSVLTEITRLGEDGLWHTLRLPWWNTREFIRLSQAEVPRGHERCDVDSWVEEITAPEH